MPKELTPEDPQIRALRASLPSRPQTPDELQVWAGVHWASSTYYDGLEEMYRLGGLGALTTAERMAFYCWIVRERSEGDEERFHQILETEQINPETFWPARPSDPE